MTARQDPVSALDAQQHELTTLLEGRSEDDLLRPSRCDGWTAADVLLHLAQTNEMAAASARDAFDEYVGRYAALFDRDGDVDDWAGVLVEAERTDPVTARDRFVASAAEQLAALRDRDPSDRLTWVAGELAARTLVSTRLSECWIHTVDIAVAYGPEPEPTDRLWHVARLAWRTLPYAFARAGESVSGGVAFHLDTPDGDVWHIGDEVDAPTVVRGTARDLCTVAGQRAAPQETSLTATGPDAEPVLRLVRTFA